MGEIAQTGEGQGHRHIPQRGLKQGGILSPSLLNAGCKQPFGMEEAWNGMEEAWYLEPLIDFLRPRLTNITVCRYVDDLMLYGYNWPKSISMFEWLCTKLRLVGLDRNPPKQNFAQQCRWIAPEYKLQMTLLRHQHSFWYDDPVHTNNLNTHAMQSTKAVRAFFAE